MLFNSFSFLVFFPVVTALYFACPHRFRWALLLAASAWFYMAFIPAYLLIILGTATIDFAAAHGMRRRPALRKPLLCAALASNLGVLGLFKYYNFLSGAAGSVAARLGMSYAAPFFSWALPIGLSFHTFQAMAYLIEVYRGNQEPERHFGIYALYILFYPQLVAGPIERPQHMLPQFREIHHFDYERAASGLRLMLWGLFKKAVIADRLAAAVTAVYGNPRAHEGPVLLLATALFAVQIYCDFSGYSDIAIGAARVMGFRLMTNFDRPYASRSIAEFWRRWHISLSSWFRDYVYVPLGGNRVGAFRWTLNILVVFALSGLWHGAGWTYLIWGLLHAGYLLISRRTAAVRERFAERTGLTRLPVLRNAWRTAATFSLVAFAWIFFRAESLSDALYVAGHLFRGWSLEWPRFLGEWQGRSLFGADFGLTKVDFAVAAGGTVLLGVVHRLQARGMKAFLDRRPIWERWACYYALIFLTLMLAPDKSNQFIYFQF